MFVILIKSFEKAGNTFRLDSDSKVSVLKERIEYQLSEINLFDNGVGR